MLEPLERGRDLVCRNVGKSGPKHGRKRLPVGRSKAPVALQIDARERHSGSGRGHEINGECGEQELLQALAVDFQSKNAPTQARGELRPARGDAAGSGIRQISLQSAAYPAQRPDEGRLPALGGRGDPAEGLCVRRYAAPGEPATQQKEVDVQPVARLQLQACPFHAWPAIQLDGPAVQGGSG